MIVRLLFLIIFLSCSGSLAAEEWSQNRSERTYYASFGADAWASLDRYNHPLELGYFLQTELLGGVKYGASSGVQRSGVAYDLNELGLWGRWFWLETVNFKAGLSHLNAQWTNDPSNSDYSGQAQAVRAYVGAGNQWHFGPGWFLSLDWALFNQVLSFSQSHSISSYGWLSASELASEVDQDADTLKNLFSYPGLAVFSVGFAF